MLHERLRRSLQGQDLVGRPIIVALSGGGDSLALLHLLVDLRDGGEVPNLAVMAAHLDHGLRPESRDEADLLRNWCRAVGVKLVRARAPVAAKARLWGVGLEATGRRLRYGWLKRLALRLGGVVVTGHTREDITETLLMRLVSGTSLSGLAGPRRGRGSWLFRPLLDSSRGELRHYLSLRGIAWLEDPTNQDSRFLRCWVRNRLIPLLEERNPRVGEGLRRLSESATDLNRWVTSRCPATGSEVLPSLLSELPLEARFYILSRAWRAARPNPGSRFCRKHFVLCQAWLEGPRRKALQMPGGLALVRIDGDRVSFTPLVSPRCSPKPVCFAVDSPVQLEWPEWGLSLEVTRVRQAEAPTPWRADLAHLPPTFFLRARQDGDRFGSTKLKRCLARWGVVAAARPSVPLLLDDQSRILWVLGHRVREEFLAPLGEPCWRFHFRPQGDQG